MGQACKRRGSAAARGALVWLVAAALTGCATYSDHVLRASRAASGGDYAGAVEALNDVLGVDSAHELPDDWKSDRALATLERGVLLQSLGQYPDAARDLSAAEEQLELLDLKLDAVGALGRYLYSDSSEAYKTPPTERLALNAINLLNYLALGDLDGAAVEARRFQVMREYLQSEGIEAQGPATLGAYLAGFVFERRGEGDRALRYYEEALGAGPLDSLASPVARLARSNPYRGPQLQALLDVGPATGPDGGADGELLLVLCLGRVPQKVPERMPIGMAVGYAGAVITDDLDWLTRSATKVLVYPELVPTPSSLGTPVVRVDGREIVIEEVSDLDAAVRQEYEEIKPKIVAAGLTRLAARAAVGEGAREAGKQESKVLGVVLSVLTESLLVALDRPDTRSWTMLPGHVLVARMPVSAGVHSVEVAFEGTAGAGRSFSVDVARDGYAAIVLTEPR